MQRRLESSLQGIYGYGIIAYPKFRKETQVDERIEVYFNLIENLLNCTTGKEANILVDNCNLIDETLVQIMKYVADYLVKSDELNAADWLQSSAVKLEEAIYNWNQLNQQVIELNECGEYAKGIMVAEQALDLGLLIWAKKHPNIVTSLQNLGAMYTSQGRFGEAEPLLLEALALCKCLLGDEHPDVAITLKNLAKLYQFQGRYSEAKPLLMEALEREKRLLGEQHPSVATSLNNLAGLYYCQGRFCEAEALYIEALDIIKRFFKYEHRSVATSLNNLALIYHSQGRYSEAEPLLMEALEREKRLLGEQHPSVANSLNSLAGLYISQGKFRKAESLVMEALEMTKRLFGEQHINVTICLNNLGLIYYSQGKFREAESLSVKVLNLTKRLLGEQHSYVAASLNNLALLYYHQGRYSKAEPLFVEALEMKKRLFVDSHPDVACTLNNLALLYSYQGKNSEAERLFVEALEITKRLLGELHPSVATCLHNLAGIYKSQGRYSEAESLFVEALEMRKGLLGESHPDVALSLRNLAGLLAATNRYTEALALSHQASEIYNDLIRQMFAASSETDRIAYLDTIRYTFYAFISLVNSHLSNSPEAKQAAYDLVLKRKALTAAAFAAFNYALYSDRYSHLAPQFKQWQSLRAEQIHLIYSPPLRNPEINEDEFRTRQAEYQKRLSDLETECKNLEKLLASQVPEIQLQQELETANRRAVALELPEGSTLIEFVRFDVFDFQAVPARGESKWKPARYLAFILPAKQPDKVEMIDLGEAEHIDKLLRVFRSYFSGKGDLLDMGDDDEETPTFMKYDTASGMELRQAVFDPIAAVIGDSKYLLVSPDGELNLLPFQLLPDETGTGFLMDEYTISYLSVGRDILRSHFQPNRPATAPLIIADPDFDLGGASETRFLGETGFLSLLGNTLERAPGTRFLGEAVAKKLEVSPYFDAEALETQITKSPSPSILLIATHGVFLPDLPHQPPTLESRGFGSRFSATKVENPMLRSGLALAGANTWLSGGTLPEKAGKGFLFAQDVAALDLWANELTVLSACNTAIGDVKIGEGVFGLRRAFAVAGTKTLVMSLWPVPDKATALLMERFFDNLKGGFGRSNALLEAQNYIRNITVRELRQSELGREVLEELLSPNNVSCQEEEKPLEHPFFWGAWVCQGETTNFTFPRP
ncbi:tetratricopeptide repeat protein [Aerosakkonema sp. BLCC-F183]|uniref:CHAT domain-containing tetratricopeptide repeat protein n=1 Tax=Aerosakkonema sp. BLCC-F183 TaxID=3342834 RepID=UPI0035B80384